MPYVSTHVLPQRWHQCLITCLLGSAPLGSVSPRAQGSASFFSCRVHRYCTARPETCAFERLLPVGSSSIMQIPSHLFAPSLLAKLRHIADSVVALHSFKGTRPGPIFLSSVSNQPHRVHRCRAGQAGSGDVAGEAFKDYSGLFYLRKLPRLNSLVWGHVPDALTFLFQMRYLSTLHQAR
jgi:hypothetical protein